MKTAVIGAGRMGRRHLQVVRELGLDLVGVADGRAESLAEAQKEHGLGNDVLFADGRVLLEERRPEVVIVATTAPGHAPLTCAAAAAGARYVLCEKPMAASLAECDEMLAACGRAGTRLAVNHQMRVMDQYTEIRKVIEGPEFGGWSSINVVAGNFGAAMNGTHYFELLRWLSGEAPSSVTAWLDPDPVASPRGPEFHDRAGSIRVSTASGKRLYLEIGADQGHGVRVLYAGRWGVAVCDELAGRIEVATRAPEHQTLPTTRYGMPGPTRTFEVAPADAVQPSRRVLEALLREDDYPTGEHGRLALATLVAAHLSAEGGSRPVAVDLTALPRDRRLDHA